MHKRVNKKQNPNTPAAAISQTRSHLLWCAVLVIITYAAFHTSLNHDFTNWDDDLYVVNNPDIRGFSAANLSKIMSTPYVDNYQPVTMLSYMIDYSLTGLDPSAYHGTNLALHIVNAILVYLLLFLLTGSRFTSGLTALLFAIHPLRVESVAWIAERKDMLFMLFYLLACINYIWYTKYKQKKLFIYALCAGILSMLSKPMAVSLPCALILIDYVQGRAITFRSLKNKIPFIAAAAGVALIALVTQKSTHAFSEFNSMSMLYRICIPFYDCVLYLFKTILPVHLCALYSSWAHPAGLTRIVMLISPVIVLAAGFAVWHFRNRSRLLVFASLWYVITLLPVLQIVPVGSAIAAERYTYLAMLGIYAFAAFSLNKVMKRHKDKRALVYTGTALVILVFAWQTAVRCSVWQNSITLWTDTVAKNPGPLAFNNLGTATVAKGNIPEALRAFNSALQLNPSYAQAYNNRGSIYAGNGANDRAIADFSCAIQYQPAYAEAYLNRGMVYCAENRLQEAILDFSRALAITPQLTKAYNERGIAFAMQGKFQTALADFDSVLVHDRNNIQARDNRNHCITLFNQMQLQDNH